MGVGYAFQCILSYEEKMLTFHKALLYILSKYFTQEKLLITPPFTDGETEAQISVNDYNIKNGSRVFPSLPLLLL